MSPILRYLWLTLLLAGCSTLPTDPDVLVLPGTGKSNEQFRSDDASCRQQTQQQLATLPELDSNGEGQQIYDISYMQCMYGKGHRVPIPRELTYGMKQEWHSPPPPNLPAPNLPVSAP